MTSKTIGKTKYLDISFFFKFLSKGEKENKFILIPSRAKRLSLSRLKIRHPSQRETHPNSNSFRFSASFPIADPTQLFMRLLIFLPLLSEQIN